MDVFKASRQMWSCSFFFFQAEDGIRDLTVTGVQTCALPILISYQSSDTSPWGLMEKCRAYEFASQSFPVQPPQACPRLRGWRPGRSRADHIRDRKSVV